MRTKGLYQDKIKMVTLGCSKNLVDSENIVTQLRNSDYDIEHEKESSNANIVIINTCGFIDIAKEESINTILDYASLRENGEIDKLYVTGCLSQRYKDDLIKEIPQVDAFFGTMEMPALLAKFDVDYKHELIGERQSATPMHYAFMKISEGCNRSCSFCAIPLIRGEHISLPIEVLVRQAKTLAGRGVKELILIAQELTYYGLDIYKKRALGELLKELVKVEGIEWIRLHYAYPHKFPEELFDIIAEEKKICNYIDIPFQHASDAVLERMHRHTDSTKQASLLKKAREKVSDISFRTTMLVGFPGETEEEFEALCDFVRENRFDRLGVFQYSHEEDTKAYPLKDDIPAEVKLERANKLMEIQREISYEINVEKIGKTFKVLIDRKENEFFVGRTEYDSPDVDNEVLIDAKKHFVRVGDFVNIKITDATEFDLIGEPVG